MPLRLRNLQDNEMTTGGYKKNENQKIGYWSQ